MRQWSLKLLDPIEPPIIIDDLNPNKFSRRAEDGYLWLMDLPIKMPGTDVMIPHELEQFKEFIEKVFLHEKVINKSIHDWYAYICVDQRPVEPGKPQRRPGAHADSFPTGRVDMIRDSDSIYIAYDCMPTEFCHGNFAFGPNVYVVDNDCPNLDRIASICDGKIEFKPFRTVSNESILKHFEGNTRFVRTYDPYQILHMDSGHVHRVAFNNSDKTIPRTFVKITFSPDIFNRFGNDHNCLFDYNWPFYQRLLERNNSSITSNYVDSNDFMHVDAAALEQAFVDGADWTDGQIVNITRYGTVAIMCAFKGELLVTNNENGQYMTCTIAKEGDLKVKHIRTNAQYFLSYSKIKELYEIVDAEDLTTCAERFIMTAKSTKAVAIKINRQIRIDTPWKVQQHLRPGDFIVKRSNDEIYGITGADMLSNYIIS